jgi:hypothetical protein
MTEPKLVKAVKAAADQGGRFGTKRNRTITNRVSASRARTIGEPCNGGQYPIPRRNGTVRPWLGLFASVTGRRREIRAAAYVLTENTLWTVLALPFRITDNARGADSQEVRSPRSKRRAPRAAAEGEDVDIFSTPMTGGTWRFVEHPEPVGS